MDVAEELVLVLFDLEERETPVPIIGEIKRRRAKETRQCVFTAFYQH